MNFAVLLASTAGHFGSLSFDARLGSQFDSQDRSLAEKLQRFEERIDARLARTERLLNLS